MPQPACEGGVALKYNLVLVAGTRSHERPTFRAVAHYVQVLDPHVHAYVLSPGRRHWPWRLYLALRPTVAVSLSPTPFRLLRGVLYQGRILTKSQQYEALLQAGVPVPRWAIITREHLPDLSDFGRYVVVKPDVGGRGAEVKIVRTDRVRWKEVHTYAGPSAIRLAQEFICTGLWPVSFRVTTLFGELLWSMKTEADHRRPVLSGPRHFDRVPGGKAVSIVSSSKGCTMSLSHDEDVIRFGERVHAAFPHIPLLGVDVIREHPSGKLYALEVHPDGSAWHFTSAAGLRIQREFGFSFEEQFDGLRKAARILATKSRQAGW